MRSNPFTSNLLLAATLTLGAPQAQALKELSDDSLSDVQGAGLAFPFDEFRFAMAPTSYIQLTGSDTDLGTGPGQTTFRRGDLRYYGLSMTRATTDGALAADGIDWAGDACSGGFRGLGCPMNDGFIQNFSNFDNPYVWRAFNYTGLEPDGAETSDRSVFEILGPSDMDAFRWAFWGEVESGRQYGAVDRGFAPITGATCGAAGNESGADCITQLQNIIIGKPVSYGKPRSIFGDDTQGNASQAPALRFFQYAGTTDETGANPTTYGLQYLHRLSGDYRLSVNKTSGSTLRGVVPEFTNEEGLYFTDVQTYLPLGQLHYQAIVFDNTQAGSTNVGTGDGNIVIELTRIPEVDAVYNDFYSLAPGDTQGYKRTNRPARYYETHGYVEWGGGFPTNPNPNGMGGSGVSQVRFSGVDPDGLTVNLNTLPNSACMGGGYGVGGGSFGTCTGKNNEVVGNIFDNNSPDLVFNTGFTRGEIASEDGMSFLSRNSANTWTVLHNQNRPQQENMIWVEYDEGGWFSDDEYQLTRDARYTSTPNQDGNMYNPMLSVNAINLGTSRVQGLQVNHLKIETLGGANP